MGVDHGERGMPLFGMWYYPRKLSVARFTSTLWQCFDLHEILLTHREDLLKLRNFTRVFLAFLLNAYI